MKDLLLVRVIITGFFQESGLIALQRQGIKKNEETILCLLGETLPEPNHYFPNRRSNLSHGPGSVTEPLDFQVTN